MVGLPQLGQGVARDFRVGDVGNWVLDWAVEDEADSIDVVQDARNNLGQEQQVVPVGLGFLR